MKCHSERSEESRSDDAGEVLKTRKHWCILVTWGCSDTARDYYLFWIPGYFQEVRGLSLATVGKILWAPYLCAFMGALAGAARIIR